MRHISNQTYYVASLLVVSLTANYKLYQDNKALQKDVTAYSQTLVNTAEKIAYMNSQFK